MPGPESSRRIGGRFRLAWVLIFGGGVALRLLLFSGYGLGDDLNYFVAFHTIYATGTYFPTDPYQMRFGMWGPVVLSMKLLGVTEAGFVGAMTACSIVNLVLVYLLARQEWEAPYALLAMALLAVYPLDVLCSTLFANDIILATWCFAAFFLFRKALAETERRAVRFTCAAASAVFLLLGFVTKPWMILMVPLFAFEALRRWRAWSASLVTAGGFMLLGGSFAAWQVARFGDPLYHIDVAKPFAIFLPYSREILLDYPRMLLLPNEYGSRFAGFYPHLLVLLAFLFVLRAPGAAKWLLFLLVMLAGLAALPSHRVNGQWVTLVPHIFRYLCLVSIPLCLALTAWLRELFRWRLAAGAAVTATLVVTSVVQCVALTEPTRDAFGEERRAMAVVRQFSGERVVSDDHFLSRLQDFGVQGGASYKTSGLRSETPEKRAEEFASVRNAVIVTGGARLPWYGCVPCLPDLGGFVPPPTWHLVAAFDDRPLGPYRHEPLRIWRCSRSEG